MHNVFILLSVLLSTLCHSVPVKPLTGVKLLFFPFYFLHYVVLLSSCVHNLQRTEEAEKQQPPLAACLCPAHCLKELNLAEAEDTCTYLFMCDCREKGSKRSKRG